MTTESDCACNLSRAACDLGSEVLGIDMHLLLGSCGSDILTPVSPAHMNAGRTIVMVQAPRGSRDGSLVAASSSIVPSNPPKHYGELRKREEPKIQRGEPSSMKMKHVRA